MALGGGGQKVQVQQIDQERGSLILGKTLLLDASLSLGLRKHSRTMWKHLITAEAVQGTGGMALCHSYPDPLITASGLKAAPAFLTHASPVGLAVFRSSPLCILAGDAVSSWPWLWSWSFVPAGKQLLEKLGQEPYNRLAHTSKNLPEMPAPQCYWGGGRSLVQ